MDAPNQTPVETSVTPETPVVVPSASPAVPAAQPLPMQTEESGSSRTRMWMIVGAAVVVLGLVATMFGGGMFKGSFLEKDAPLPLYVKIQGVDKNDDDKSRTIRIDIMQTDKDHEIPSSRKFSLHVLTRTKGTSEDKLLFTKPWNTSGTITFRPNQTLAYKVRVPASELNFSTIEQVTAQLFEIDAAGNEAKIKGDFAVSKFIDL